MTQAARPASITCARCGVEKEVGQRGPVPVYCSGACRTGAKHDVRNKIECARCGTSTRARQGTIYCSPRCRNASNHDRARGDGTYDKALRAAKEATRVRRTANARPCRYCAAPMPNPRAKQCGAPDCKRAFDAERGREWQRNYREKTGQWYRQDKYSEQQRQYERRRRAESGHWRERYPEAAAAGDARRRMLVQQARTDEVFAPIDVHDRDGWTCQLCWLPIAPEVAWPDPMSPSLDHRIPLSRGGVHAMSNVQSAHLGCNSSKGDKLLTELIGDLRTQVED